MLLKYSQTQKRAKLSASGKPQRVTGMKLTSNMIAGPRVHRKMMKNITNRKHNTTHHRAGIGLKRELKSSVTPVDPCDNSNDSGLGFDHHSDYPIQHRNRPSSRFLNREKTCCSEDASRFKKHRLDFKVESDEDANDYFSFYETVQQQKTQGIHNFPRCISSRRFDQDVQQPLTGQLNSYSRDGRVSLEIISEPESQHRARYQTEGSRGAVKDRTGSSFPVVRLNGYSKPTVLQVFIGTDEGDVAPHMFYQACRVAGKNSTPSVETMVDRTVVIEMDIHPVNNMITVCDCVGILKERNVDVEHRFPDGSPPSKNSRKKSTSVRMVFRTAIRLADGSYETLQVTSDTIACTQPQGVPEVSLMSWTSSPVTGGVDLFVIGKNFVKDTKVVFYEGEDDKAWKVSVQPNKDFLHQSHLVCKVPPYVRTNISSPVQVRVVVESCGKSSESQAFSYTPIIGYLPSSPTAAAANPSQGAPQPPLDTPGAMPEVTLMEARSTSSNFQQNQRREFHPVMLWSSPFVNPQPMDPAAGLRRPDLPAPPLPLPKCVCHKECIQMQLMHSALLQPAIEAEQSQQVVKKEHKDLPLKLSGAGIVAELSTTQQPSLATIRQFVSNQTSEHPLPSINVENYLSRLENPPTTFVVPKQEQPTSQTALEIGITSAPIDLSNQLVSSMPVQDAIKSEPTFGELMQRPAAPLNTAVPRCGKRKFSNDTDDTVDMKMSCLTFPNQTTTDSMLVAPSNSLLTPRQCMQDMIDSRNISSELPQPLVDLVGSSLASNEATERLDDLVNSAAEKHMSSSSSTSSSPGILSPIISPAKSPTLLSPPLPTNMSTNSSPLNLLPTPLEDLSTAHHNNMMMTQPQGSGSDMLSSSMTVVGLSNGQLVSPIEKSYTSTTPSTNLLLQNLVPERKKDTKDGHLSLMREMEINRIPGAGCTMVTDPVVVPSGYGTVPVPVSNLLQSDVQQSSMALIPLTIPNASDNILPVSLTKVPQTVSLLPMSTEQTVPLSTNQSESTVKRPVVGNPLTGGIQELTQMSENDLLSYINPSCFDQV